MPATARIAGAKFSRPLGALLARDACGDETERTDGVRRPIAEQSGDNDRLVFPVFDPDSSVDSQMRLERNAVPWPNIAGAAEAKLQPDKVALDISRVRSEQVIAKCGVRKAEVPNVDGREIERPLLEIAAVVAVVVRRLSSRDVDRSYGHTS